MDARVIGARKEPSKMGAASKSDARIRLCPETQVRQVFSQRMDQKPVGQDNDRDMKLNAIASSAIGFRV